MQSFIVSHETQTEKSPFLKTFSSVTLYYFLTTSPPSSLWEPDRMPGNGTILHQGRFRPDIRKKFLYYEGGQTSLMLCRQVVDVPKPVSIQEAFGPFPLIICFSFWLALKCSGSWTWWSLKVPSNWSILYSWGISGIMSSSLSFL